MAHDSDNGRGGDDAVERFLSQPAATYEEDAEPKPEAPFVDRQAPTTFFQRLNTFLFEKKPSAYSSIAPRNADGTRTKIFFFNGNGRSR